MNLLREYIREMLVEEAEDPFDRVKRISTEILGYTPSIDKELDGSITVLTRDDMSNHPAFRLFLSRFPGGEWVDFDEFSTGIIPHYTEWTR